MLTDIFAKKASLPVHCNWAVIKGKRNLRQPKRNFC